MARCEICKKSKTVVKSGRHRQTVNVARRGSMGLRGHKSSKKLQPNTRKVKISVPISIIDKRSKSSDKSSKTVSMTMCMSCYKKYRENQSFRAKVLASRCSA